MSLRISSVSSQLSSSSVDITTAAGLPLWVIKNLFRLSLTCLMMVYKLVLASLTDNVCGSTVVVFIMNSTTDRTIKQIKNLKSKNKIDACLRATARVAPTKKICNDRFSLYFFFPQRSWEMWMSLSFCWFLQDGGGRVTA